MQIRAVEANEVFKLTGCLTAFLARRNRGLCVLKASKRAVCADDQTVFCGSAGGAFSDCRLREAKRRHRRL